MGDQEVIPSIPPFNTTNSFERLYYKLRDWMWKSKIERMIQLYNLLDYDYYHFEWGMDCYRNFAFALRIKELEKPIIANYHGQDIRTRGIFRQMDKLADINITSEAD